MYANQQQGKTQHLSDSVDLPPMKHRESPQYLWVLSGLALTACGGGGGGGLHITAPPPLPPINQGAPTAHSRIPAIQTHSAPEAASVVVLAEGTNAFPNLHYEIQAYTWTNGRTGGEVRFDVAIPDITLNADGAIILPSMSIEIDDWILQNDPPDLSRGTSSRSDGYLRAEIDDYQVEYSGLTTSNPSDIIDYLRALDHGEATSLQSVWTLLFRSYDADGNPLDTINPAPFTINGVARVQGGGIDVPVAIYTDANGMAYFQDAAGRTVFARFVITFNDGDLAKTSTAPGSSFIEGPEISLLGISKGNGYQVPIIITNLAKDGFGNAKIVLADGTADSTQEMLRIEADGVSGNVYADGHRWYKDGVEIQGSTAHTHRADGAGAYHADVAIDIDFDGHADIWVETLPIDIA